MGLCNSFNEAILPAFERERLAPNRWGEVFLRALTGRVN
jgi:hypothetical protein